MNVCTLYVPRCFGHAHSWEELDASHKRCKRCNLEVFAEYGLYKKLMNMVGGDGGEQCKKCTERASGAGESSDPQSTRKDSVLIVKCGKKDNI